MNLFLVWQDRALFQYTVDVVCCVPGLRLASCSIVRYCKALKAVVVRTPVRLFTNLTADCRPIATPERKYSKADKTFISHEVKRLQSEGLIEPSNSPWRAQPLVSAQENHRK